MACFPGARRGPPSLNDLRSVEHLAVTIDAGVLVRYDLVNGYFIWMGMPELSDILGLDSP
jgi:hypothetical protein